MGTFKLGKMTFGSLFKQPETVQYPFQTRPQPLGLKGHIRCDVDACILCGMCERSCTTDCIKVDKQARTWQINAFGCVQCGYCVTICPRKCLYMEPDYHPSATNMTADVLEVPVGSGKAKPEAGATTQEKAQSRPVAASSGTPHAQERDMQLESLITMMNPDAAEKVLLALSR